MAELAQAMLAGPSAPRDGEQDVVACNRYEHGKPRSNVVIAEVLEAISEGVAVRRPQKFQLHQRLQEALATSDVEILRDCSLEVVGSVSWDGEVPQSDLDLMLCTPSADLDGNAAIALLQELHRCLENDCSNGRNGGWARLDLLDTARIPILCIQDEHGISCDVAVDQMRGLRHRDFFTNALEKRPEVRSLIQLVKFWVRQRGLPSASEGGLPSLAWVLAALSISEEQPSGTALEVLVMHFFVQMSRLGSESVYCCPSGSKGSKMRWSGVGQRLWAKEWAHMFQVAEPTESHCGGRRGRSKFLDSSSITPSSMPTALGLLYAAELQLAWKAIRAERWEDVWRPMCPEAKGLLPRSHPSQHQENNCQHLHLVLLQGVLLAGAVHRPIGLPAEAPLHHRDQGSELELQPLGVANDLSLRLASDPIRILPCHWVCALPAQDMTRLRGDGENLVKSLIEILHASSVSPGILSLVGHQRVPSMTPGLLMPMAFQMPRQMPAHVAYHMPIMFFMPVNSQCAVTSNQTYSKEVTRNSDPNHALALPSHNQSCKAEYVSSAAGCVPQRAAKPHSAANGGKHAKCSGGRPRLLNAKIHKCPGRSSCSSVASDDQSDESTRASDTETEARSGGLTGPACVVSETVVVTCMEAAPSPQKHGWR